MPSMSQGGRHRKAQALTLPRMYEVRRVIPPEAYKKWEHKARTSKKEWKWQRGTVTHPPSESQWNRGHFSLKMWESEKTKSWCMPAEEFKGHVATDGSLLDTSVKWEHVAGLWCHWNMMKNWGFCVGCTARWRQHLRSSAPSRGRS